MRETGGRSKVELTLWSLNVCLTLNLTLILTPSFLAMQCAVEFNPGPDVPNNPAVALSPRE